EIVLHLDGASQEPQAAHEGVSQGRIAQVADVRRLVGVDVRVLDDDLARNLRVADPAVPAGADACRELVGERASIEVEVQVPGSGDVDSPDAGHARRCLGELERDLARRAPDQTRQFEGDGQGQLAQLYLRRGGEVEPRRFDLVTGPYLLEDRSLDSSGQLRKHRGSTNVNIQDRWGQIQFLDFASSANLNSISLMRIVYFEPFSGISGDMTLGALVDLGTDLGRLRSELAHLGVEGYEISSPRSTSGRGASCAATGATRSRGRRPSGCSSRPRPILRESKRS